MKRLVVVLGGLLALPAFAEVAPYFYDGVSEYSDVEMVGGDAVASDEVVAENVVAKPYVQPKASARMGASSRAVSAGASNMASGRGIASSRSVAPRGATSARTASNVASRGTTSRSVASRAATNTGVVSARRAANSNATVARVAAAGTVGTMTTSGGTATAVQRVGVRSAGSTARAPSVAAVSVSNNSTVATAESVKDATTTMDALAELTDYCKAQYTSCMDNFCNVLDDNQGRCSCSKNVKNYEKTEAALKAATEELQEVAQKIQYIGLSKDEITTLFAETEAETEMRGSSDSSQIKSSLDKIKNMIVDAKSGTASSVIDAGSDISFDLSNLLSFNFNNTGFDLSALFGTNSTNTSAITNQRGETLYKSASARCKAAVLNSCASQGVDIAVVANSYDLEIDKQCIVYERALNDSNTEMLSTVRNARSVLQKARLMVAQQKNQYDLRGCISALDSCMQDDYVCGADYEYCLDPSGKYVVDGQIVVGSLPGKALTNNMSAGLFKDGLYQTWKFGSITPWDDSNDQNGKLAEYISGDNGTLTDTVVDHVDPNMSKFLQYKIGYNAGGKNFGMCMSVLNKCQNYTYENNGYKNNNRVVEEYLYRTLPRIKAAQDALLANYAENCIADVTSCLSANNYKTESGANNNIAINACKSIITTCMSVNGNVTGQPDPDAMTGWADGVYRGTITTSANN